MLPCAIDAKEGRYVIMPDIHGAFLHLDMEDEVHMILEGTIAELIIKLDQTGNIFGTVRKVSRCCTYSSRKPYTGHYRRHCYFGNYYPQHYRSGVSRSTGMTNVLRIKL